MAKKMETALEDFRAALKKEWEAINLDIKKVVARDRENSLLNIRARKILQIYLDRYVVLAKSDVSRSTTKEIVWLLDSLKYLVKLLKKQGKKKRPLV